ncbi:unnamed protein product, partial [Nippostrongylus brasiliensis]|uniref:Chromatin assembly factor 1 subunit A (inferred by orthology to a human protein) n=1 Tax=Nippostrongylus brasiliensis TaxID=27835 RepID=A0A0N4Y9M8_NIPBR
MTDVDVDTCTKENEINAEARGVKRPSSVNELDTLKKTKSSGRATPSGVATPRSAAGSLKKATPKMSKEEREAERARKALQKKLKEEERERARAEKERLAEEKRLEKERKEKQGFTNLQYSNFREREEKRKEEERKKEEKRREEEERKERKRKEEEEKQKRKEELAAKKREEEERKEAKRREEEERKEAKRREEEVEKKKPEVADKTDDDLWYLPFEVKDGMTLAPIQRRAVLHLDDNILEQIPEISQKSYLASISSEPRKLVGPPHNPMRAKLFQFHDNYRPPYYGTWRTRSKAITGRRPFSVEEENIDYEVDSDAEWEEEPSDAEECKSDEEDDAGGEDSDADSELDEFFVEPGYLSDGE